MRNHAVLITEAELLASSPERVHQWLEARAKKADGSFDTQTDEELDQALLARNEPLIELGLARFTLYGDIAKELFARAGVETSKLGHVRALRVAVLSNEALAKGSIWGLPAVIFGDGDEGIVQWIAQADRNEISALFQNPTASDSFLRAFFDGEKVWQAMDEEHRLAALGALAGNRRMRQDYDGIMDGYAEYSHGSVFNAAWKLAETAPTTTVWAYVLGSLYNRLQREAFSMDAPLEVGKRWQPDAADPKSSEREASSNESGYLGPYQNVRKGLACLALEKKCAIGPDLLASDDVALRAAAYATMALSPEQIGVAYERDKEIAVNEAVHNEQIWRRPESRKALHDICWQAVRDDKHSDLMAANIFNGVKERMAKEHPQWFEDEGYKPEAADKPATKADVQQVVEALGRSGEGSPSIAAILAQLRQSIEAVNSRLGWVRWFVLGVLVATVWRHI